MRNKIISYRSDLKMKARKLRKDSTSPEVILWAEIRRRKLGVQFHRQVPMLDYIVDFYCHELMLAIEVDGSSHDHPDAVDYDDHRQKRLENEGVYFLRFTNEEVRKDLKWVVNEIFETVNEMNDGR